MPAFKKWCRDMTRSIRGRSHLSDIWHDCESGRLDSHVIREFFDAIAQRWAMAHPNEKPYTPIQTIVEEAADRWLCQGQPQLQPEHCSRLVPASDFFRKNVDLDKIGFTRLADEPEDRAIVWLERKPSLLRGEIPDGPKRVSAWVTKTGSVDLVRDSTSPQELGPALRDKLGLVHLYKRSKVLEVRYPVDAFESVQLLPPTFLDGAWNMAYRSKRASDHWGTSVDIANGQDGMPEAVHTRVTVSRGFTVRRVGWTDDINLESVKRRLGRLWREAAVPVPWKELDAALEELRR